MNPVESDLHEIQKYCETMRSDVNAIKVRHWQYIARKPGTNLLSVLAIILKS